MRMVATTATGLAKMEVPVHGIGDQADLNNPAEGGLGADPPALPGRRGNFEIAQGETTSASARPFTAVFTRSSRGRTELRPGSFPKDNDKGRDHRPRQRFHQRAQAHVGSGVGPDTPHPPCRFNAGLLKFNVSHPDLAKPRTRMAIRSTTADPSKSASTRRTCSEICASCRPTKSKLSFKAPSAAATGRAGGLGTIRQVLLPAVPLRLVD